MSPSSPASTSPATKEHRCSECGKAFGRVEHLRRHILTHSKDKGFSCRDCPKQFVRRDALKRHELTHRSAPNLLKRGVRACAPCAAAKARCSGDRECLRCRTRGDTCIYPAVRDLDGMQFSDSGEGSSLGMADQSPSLIAAPSQSMDMHVALQAPSMSQNHEVDIHDADLWDPSVLASTNWLDALDDCDFPNFSLPSIPMALANGAQIPGWNDPSTSSHHPSAPLSNTRPIATRLSTVSTPATAENISLTDESLYDHDSPEAGQFYIDGGPARLPRTKRRKPSSSAVIRSHQGIHAFSLAYTVSSDSAGLEVVPIGADEHRVLREWYGQVCLNDRGIWPTFEKADFPSASLLGRLIELYFLHFDQVLPFIHRATFSNSRTDGVLLLAMAAIGSVYLPEKSVSATFTSSLLEFTRRITLSREENGASEPDPRNMARVRILLTVGLLYCGQKGPSKAGLALSGFLKDVHRSAEDEFNQLGAVSEQDHSSTESQWLAWCRREAAIRLAHSAWLVDCMGKFHLGIRPCLRCSDTGLPLPCSESLWTARNAQEWSDSEDARSQETKSLQGALSELYIDKRLPRGRGEFARIIMIHGLFHRYWEVEDYHSNPLSSWQPTAARQSSADMLPNERIWLPGIQTFRKWENISADALDMLHWQANATIGQASGLEHSTVLHLHLARIVMLVPYPQILSWAKAWGSGDLRETGNREIVQRWAVQHQYKARLAAVHAGVVLWHIRRYSIDAFYEAPAVGLATLTLWTFGTFAAQLTRPDSPSSVASLNSEAETRNIILLDRPTDDELVQQFIRHDQSFQAHLTGVGDLYHPNGPRRVVLQGYKLLSTLRCWGVNASWMTILQGVSSAYQKS